MANIESLDPALKDILAKMIPQLETVTGLKWGVVSTKRSMSEQHALYERGRTKPGQKVTNADAGQSPHNFGMACDLCPMKDGAFWWNAPDNIWQMYGEMAEGLGLTWGGNFKSICDKPHVELPTWKQTQTEWKAGGSKLA